MSFKNWQPDLEIRVSPEVVCFLFLVHGLALTSLFLSSIRGVPFFLLLGLVLMSGAFGVVKNLLTSLPFSKSQRVVRLKWNATEDALSKNWALYYADGKKINASLHPSSVVMSNILFLTFSVGFKKEKLILTQRNVNRSEWRRLAVGLRYNAF